MPAGRWRDCGGCLLLLALALPSLPSHARAQQLDDARLRRVVDAATPQGPSPSVMAGRSAGGVPSGEEAPAVSWGPLVPRWTAPVASLLVPGLGQLRLGQDRFVAYAASELYLWTKYVKDLRELRRQRQAYKTLARDVARYFYSRNGPDGDWDYYEVMGKDYLESGAYSTTASGDVVPETDPATYNGHIWRLALRTYWGNPDTPPLPGSAPYNEALALYKRRAVPPELRWSWRNSQLERDLYRRAISRANDSFRRATVGGSLIVANHLLSAVDAFVVVRLESLRTPDGDQRVGATVRVPVP